VSTSNPKPFFASLADMDFIVGPTVNAFGHNGQNSS
jgi:hypothetical protein